MAYLVRKLNKRENIKLIGEAKDIENMYADAVTSEFRTKDGTLSAWRIEGVNSLADAVLAIAVTSSKVERMDFIVINTDYLKEQNLEFQQTYAGLDIAVHDLQDTHYDIKNITVLRLINCARLYQHIYRMDEDGEKFIVRYSEGEIKDLLKKANEESRLDINKLNKEIRKLLTPR